LRARSREGRPAVRRRPPRPERARVLARADALDLHPRGAAAVRTERTRRRTRRLVEAQAIRRDDAERPAPSDRSQPRLPDGMTDCNHCTGLSRSRLLHRAAAEAGRGLPAIEPGMPLPAGTGLSRRSFVAHRVGALEEGIAAAASASGQPVLVSVFLEGGADALSVLSPQGDPLYRKLRPRLALSGGATFAEDDRLRWHPAADGLARLYGEQKVTVMPAIGYTNADQSHFTSRHYWEVGATDVD